jgi:hypothetical protein
VSDNGSVGLAAWIRIKQFVPPAEDQDSGIQEDKKGDAEGNAQRRNPSLFNYRHDRGTARLHVKPVPALSIDFYNASAGFSAATEELIAPLSFEVQGLASTV